MWQKPRAWSQRYAGWEPELHHVEVFPKKGISLKALIDSETEDRRLGHREPLRPVKRVTGVRA